MENVEYRKEKSLIYKEWAEEAPMVTEYLIQGSKRLKSTPQVLFER